jgi:hypothetical protein
MRLGKPRPVLVVSRLVVLSVLLLSAFGLAGTVIAQTTGTFQSTDQFGHLETFTTAGTIDKTNPFFQSLGTNGRTCATCHIQASAWSIQPSDVTRVFNATQGLDPLFASVDGVDNPTLPMNTLAQRKANTTMIQTRGVFRIDLPLPQPPNAEFVLVDVNDPYKYIQPGSSHLSLYRRPLPSTNLSLLTGVMWDQRNTIQPITTTNTTAQNIANVHTDVDQTTISATMTHAQGTAPPTAAQIAAIDAFEFGLFTAQANSTTASTLSGQGATGGSVAVSTTPFFVGINDSAGATFTTTMTLFAPWANLTGTDQISQARLSIARGETLFNTLPITITTAAPVPGLNGPGDPFDGQQMVVTCSTCHDTPNIGSHSVPLMLNTGVAQLTNPVKPSYVLRNISTSATITVSDPGLAMLTGKWNDIGKFKVPVLRGLAGRAPYFHDGEGASLGGVIVFYEVRFNFTIPPQDIQDLTNFLESL